VGIDQRLRARLDRELDLAVAHFEDVAARRYDTDAEMIGVRQRERGDVGRDRAVVDASMAGMDDLEQFLDHGAIGPRHGQGVQVGRSQTGIAVQ
jgi:hypothetical protein